jgi:hypothetical protein
VKESIPISVAGRYHIRMTRIAADVPADSAILCEHCGYTLDGLPPGGNCPECGNPVADSVASDGRMLIPWEKSPSVATFLSASTAIIFRPSNFFRHFLARGPQRAARQFAMAYWAIGSLLFAVAAYEHQLWYARYYTDWTFVKPPLLLALWAAGFIAFYGITLLATRLTVWEARFRGLRLTRDAVLRGLDYHAAHYLPVGILAAATTWGHNLLVEHRIIGPTTDARYLWIVSGEVVLCAMYLFWTYWAAMRNMMYANR